MYIIQTLLAYFHTHTANLLLFEKAQDSSDTFLTHVKLFLIVDLDPRKRARRSPPPRTLHQNSLHQHFDIRGIHTFSKRVVAQARKVHIIKKQVAEGVFAVSARAA
jgi:hypothetical protein